MPKTLASLVLAMGRTW